MYFLTENTHQFKNPQREEAVKPHFHPCLHTNFLTPLEISSPEEDLLRGRNFATFPLSHWGGLCKEVSQFQDRGVTTQTYVGT